MSNSNYSIGLQRLNPFTLRMVPSACPSGNCLGHETYMAETETSASRDREVANFSRDKTQMRRWYVSRSRTRPQPWCTTYVCVYVYVYIHMCTRVWCVESCEGERAAYRAAAAGAWPWEIRGRKVRNQTWRCKKYLYFSDGHFRREKSLLCSLPQNSLLYFCGLYVIM